MPVHPVLFINGGSQLAYKRLRRFVKEEGSTRTDDHASFEAGQHHVRAALVPKEPRSVRANDGDNDMVIFVPWQSKSLPVDNTCSWERTLERIDVEDFGLPCQILDFELCLYARPLAIVGGEDAV